MTTTNTAKTSPAAEPIAVLERPVEIDPNQVRRIEENFAWKTYLARLPAGATAQDLNEPAIWRLVQLDPNKALTRLDRVTILDYSESFIVDAVVAHATERGVSLAIIKKVDLPARTEQLLETELYKTEWIGVGYATFRKRDRQMMTDIVPSKMLAERAHANLYPRRGA